ncbi:hypothetical protein MPH_00136 [Macrophomina phaseolina MS6]|uniref:Uncharacterized protein n=1 Tax=Macrophomina phaseolina (strain MS6) TaxID=1126212 RepID=K2S6U1_MACPH|nr:hypothetical protein MPH_00136 [Macrophomina phaseolina MS6]
MTPARPNINIPTPFSLAAGPPDQEDKVTAASVKKREINGHAGTLHDGERNGHVSDEVRIWLSVGCLVGPAAVSAFAVMRFGEHSVLSTANWNAMMHGKGSRSTACLEPSRFARPTPFFNALVAPCVGTSRPAIFRMWKADRGSYVIDNFRRGFSHGAKIHG